MSTGQVNHGERAHALLSASSAHRWLVCTPSARLEENYPDSKSVYAEEGTLAHELAEIKLRSKRDLVMKVKSTPEQTLARRAKVTAIKVNPLYSVDMEEYTDMYVDHVIGAYKKVLKKDSAAVLLIEEKLDFSRYVPDGFGTGDAIVVGNGTLSGFDLKYGQGNAVYAFENPQMKLYGLGAIEALNFLFEFDKVELHIVQPRKDNISAWETTVAYLEEWAETELLPAAQTAHAGEGEKVTGDHCKYCKHKVHCTALADEAKQLFATQAEHLPNGEHKTGDINKELHEEYLLEIFEMKSRVEDYMDAVAAHITQTAIEGKKWPGYKLVEGRSVRVLDSEQAERVLLDNGYTEEDIFEKKMLGITALEKKLGKKWFSELLDPVCTKPPGKPTLVPESDRRPALDPEENAKRMFGHIE